MQKGPSTSTLAISHEDEDEVDEIEDFIHGRHVTSSEAHWHIMGYQLYSMYPTVIPLSVHMPGAENVAINENTGSVTIVTSQLND